MQTDLLIARERRGTRIRVGGTIHETIAPAFALAVTRDVRLLAARDETILLDLEQLELHDGASVERAVEVLADLCEQAPLVVRHTPLELARRLEGSCLLDSGRLTLELPRGL
jgi:hypothetical protein